RKSAVFTHALAPIQVHEKNLQKDAAPRIAEMQSARRVLEAKLKAAEIKEVKATDIAEATQARDEARRLSKELAACEVPDPPQLSCDDITHEKLIKVLARQGGRMLQASAEGTAFEIAAGRYSDGPVFDVYLKGHSGDQIRNDRITRDS